MTDVQQPAGSSRRLPMVVLVMVVVLAGIATALFLVTLLSGPGPSAGTDASPTPSASLPDATPEPTASATAQPPEPTPQPLAPDTIAVATVNDLNMRERPASDATSIGHLSAGDRVFVLQGPQQADGFGWYQVAVVNDGEWSFCMDDCPARVGWVAGATDVGETWLAPDELSCPPAPKMKAFAQLKPFERLACYGDQPLTLRGVIWEPCCGYVGVTVYEPNWLSWPSGPPSLSYTEHVSYSGLLLRFNPEDGLEEPDYADIVRVTGHLDDPAAPMCTVRVDDWALSQDPTLKVDPQELAFAPIGCRTQFVVDSIDILGNTGETCGC